MLLLCLHAQPRPPALLPLSSSPTALSPPGPLRPLHAINPPPPPPHGCRPASSHSRRRKGLLPEPPKGHSSKTIPALPSSPQTRSQVLVPSTPLNPGDLFGAAVTIDATGTLLAAGAPGSTGAQGKVYIFEINWHATLVQQGHTTPNAWGHIQTLSASDAAAGDKFGFSLSMSSYNSAASPTSVLVIGAPMATGGNNLANAGKIYIFHRTGALLSASAWSQAASFTVASLGAQYQETVGGCFGASVAAFDTCAPPFPQCVIVTSSAATSSPAVHDVT